MCLVLVLASAEASTRAAPLSQCALRNHVICMILLLRLRRLSVHTYQIRLLNARGVYETSLKVVPSDRVYVPNQPSQLALFVRDNLKLGRLTVCFYEIRLVNLRYSMRQLLRSRRLFVYANQVRLPR